MSVTVATIVTGVKLLWDIYQKVTTDTIEVENNPQIRGGAAKSKYVEQEAIRAIDGLDLPDELKLEAKRNLRTAIDNTVTTLNDNGLFAHEPKG